MPKKKEYTPVERALMAMEARYLGVTATARKHGASVSTVSAWLDVLNSGGSFEDKERSGRPRIAKEEKKPGRPLRIALDDTRPGPSRRVALERPARPSEVLEDHKAATATGDKRTRHATDTRETGATGAAKEAPLRKATPGGRLRRSEEEADEGVSPRRS